MSCGCSKSIIRPCAGAEPLRRRSRDSMGAIVFLATAWGAEYGGVNSFNAALCTALAAAVSCPVVCAVLRATPEARRAAAAARVHLISVEAPSTYEKWLEEHAEQLRAAL